MIRKTKIEFLKSKLTLSRREVFHVVWYGLWVLSLVLLLIGSK
jgi:hypothetical protein